MASDREVCGVSTDGRGGFRKKFRWIPVLAALDNQACGCAAKQDSNIGNDT
jgi:hypothetical protein